MQFKQIEGIHMMRNAIAMAAMVRADFIPFFERIDRQCQEHEMMDAGDNVGLARLHIENLRGGS